MARPRSEDKRKAILAAATNVVAKLGVSAATAKISKAAGVAEGTLFTYFDDKDALLNELFLELKRELRDAKVGGAPASGALVDRARHMWDRYVNWGVAHPTKRRALHQLAVSDHVTPASKQIAKAMFAEVDATLQEGLAGGPLRDQPPALAGAILMALAETTIDFMAREPKRADNLKRAGFEAFWNAISRS
jgi:AcrR family transcriptional regulator